MLLPRTIIPVVDQTDPRPAIILYQARMTKRAVNELVSGFMLREQSKNVEAHCRRFTWTWVILVHEQLLGLLHHFLNVVWVFLLGHNGIISRKTGWHIVLAEYPDLRLRDFLFP